MRILLIDDDVLVSTWVVTVLERAGYEVLAVSDARRLDQVIDRFEPDVVLTDVYMPEVDGFQALRLLRSARPHLPVVMISGGAGPLGNCLPMATMLGASAILQKPLTKEMLLETVRSCAGPAAVRADRADASA